MVGLTYVAAVLATLPLVLILGYLIREGASSLSVDFFTQMPRPVGEAGGVDEMPGAVQPDLDQGVDHWLLQPVVDDTRDANALPDSSWASLLPN